MFSTMRIEKLSLCLDLRGLVLRASLRFYGAGKVPTISVLSERHIRRGEEGARVTGPCTRCRVPGLHNPLPAAAVL